MVVAWQGHEWHDLAELRTQIAYLVEHDVPDQSTQEFDSHEPLEDIQQPRDEPTRANLTYEAVARTLEEEDLYMACLIK